MELASNPPFQRLTSQAISATGPLSYIRSMGTFFCAKLGEDESSVRSAEQPLNRV